MGTMSAVLEGRLWHKAKSSGDLDQLYSNIRVVVIDVQTYVTITRFIIAHIKEKYTKGGAEIAYALENEEEYDFTPLKPELQIAKTKTKH